MSMQGLAVGVEEAGSGRAATYSRVSANSLDSASIQQQQQRCRDLAHRKGIWVQPELEFADRAVSSSEGERVGLGAMLNAAAAGDFDVLYVEGLDRLARESALVLAILKQLVSCYHVRVICVSEGIDTAEPGWELLVHCAAVPGDSQQGG